MTRIYCYRIRIPTLQRTDSVPWLKNRFDIFQNYLFRFSVKLLSLNSIFLYKKHFIFWKECDIKLMINFFKVDMSIGYIYIYYIILYMAQFFISIYTYYIHVSCFRCFKIKVSVKYLKFCYCNQFYIPPFGKQN